MKKNDEIDQMIKEALSEDEKELFNSYDEQGMLEMFGVLFHGKMRWLNGLTFVIQLMMLGFAVYFGFRFFGTTETIEMLQFGAGFFTMMMGVSMIKIFHFMEMNKNATIREIKRMELQLSILANKQTAK
ncbi:DUF6768 family protein [Ekhidna sp.]|uniref:DUF6768 family protein n=1 Tax=Ekhidna sp. TaxID=2608089 RepID=UPI003297A92B